MKRVEALGLSAISIPLFSLESVAWPVPDATRYDGLLLTSANAVRCAGEGLNAVGSLPVYAVGPTTAAAAVEVGLTIASTGIGGVDDLLGSLPSSGRLLHLCGEHRHAPSLSGSAIDPLTVYRSVEISSPLGLDRLSDAVALVHSSRAGRRLAQVAPYRSRLAIAAISPAAADACGSGWEMVSVAEQPREDSLLSLVARLCEQSPP